MEKPEETYAELLARLYPAGEKTCAECGVTNKTGESFNMKKGWSLDHLCKACEKVDNDTREGKQKAQYASGEDTPEYTDNITCPWCGYGDEDSGECDDEDDEHECGSCGGIFSYTRNVSVTYSSERVSPPELEEADKP